MPKLAKRQPSYRRHSTRNVAFVELSGQRRYLAGEYGSAESRAAYDRVIGEWLQNGRQLPAGSKSNDSSAPAPMSVTELAVAYWDHAQEYYRKDGKPTGHLCNVRFALRRLRKSFGRQPAREFGPRKLKALRESMVTDEGLSRNYINAQVQIMKRAFRWAASEEHIPGSVFADLDTVTGLRVGRTAARETPPVQPVADDGPGRTG